MEPLKKYLNTKSQWHSPKEFPENFDENLDNIVDFLKSQGFEEIPKPNKDSFYLSDSIELFSKLDNKSYLRYTVKTGTRLAFSNGGIISEKNPLFSIYKANLTSHNINTYDENKGFDKDGTYFTRRYKTSKEFSNRVNTYFNW